MSISASLFVYVARSRHAHLLLSLSFPHALWQLPQSDRVPSFLSSLLVRDRQNWGHFTITLCHPCCGLSGKEPRSRELVFDENWTHLSLQHSLKSGCDPCTWGNKFRHGNAERAQTRYRRRGGAVFLCVCKWQFSSPLSVVICFTGGPRGSCQHRGGPDWADIWRTGLWWPVGLFRLFSLDLVSSWHTFLSHFPLLHSVLIFLSFSFFVLCPSIIFIFCPCQCCSSLTLTFYLLYLSMLLSVRSRCAGQTTLRRPPATALAVEGHGAVSLLHQSDWLSLHSATAALYSRDQPQVKRCRRTQLTHDAGWHIQYIQYSSRSNGFASSF